LEVFPQDVFLRVGETHRFLVTAYDTDGWAEDFTHQVLYDAGQSPVASVSSSGLIEAKKPGETGVLIKAAGYLVRAGVGVLSETLKEFSGEVSLTSLSGTYTQMSADGPLAATKPARTPVVSQRPGAREALTPFQRLSLMLHATAPAS
jgi:hypothetical protein